MRKFTGRFFTLEKINLLLVMECTVTLILMNVYKMRKNCLTIHCLYAILNKISIQRTKPMKRE